MLSLVQKGYIVFFDRGIKLDELLSTDDMSQHVNKCQVVNITELFILARQGSIAIA